MKIVITYVYNVNFNRFRTIVQGKDDVHIGPSKQVYGLRASYTVYVSCLRMSSIISNLVSTRVLLCSGARN